MNIVIPLQVIQLYFALPWIVLILSFISFVDSGKLTSFSTSKLRGQKFKQPKPTSSLSLQRFTAYNGSLSKLQGQGVTQFGGFVWRRIRMDDCSILH